MTTEFKIQGLVASEADLLGIWQPTPIPSTELAFGLTDAPAEEADTDLVWSVSLPADTNLAQSALHQRYHELQLTKAANDQAQRQLTTLAPQTSEQVSFGGLSPVETPEATTPADIRLWDTLAYLRGEEEQSLSFGIGPSDIAANWSQTVAEFQAFMKQVLQLMRPTLQVETNMGINLIAASQVGLTGDLTTNWYQTQSSANRSLHEQTLILSLQSRITILQLVGQISTGAAVLAVRFNLPGGQLMALPAAWRYLQDVSRQARKLRLPDRSE